MDVRERRPSAAEIAERPAPWRYGLVLLALLVVGGVVLRLLDATGLPPLRNFLLVSGSLLIEALPFILLGATVSAAIEVFVPARVFGKLAALPRGLQMPMAGLGGFAFPVCECGSVPVARRLAIKGLHPAAAVTYMLASPILNPIVIVATAVAYRGREALWWIVGGRMVLGLAAALAVGWVVGRQGKEELLRAPTDAHDHHEPGRGRWPAFFGQLSSDFIMLSRYLVIGAAVAAALQTFVPQGIVTAVADTPVLSVVVMMGLAALLSLCSESDAFVAASFVQFSPGAQLAFLVFGPMVDAKLGFLYVGTFSRGFFRTVVLVAGAVTLAGVLWIDVMVR
jgi:uncharacterized protein